MTIYQIYDTKNPLCSIVDLWPGILEVLPTVNRIFGIKKIKGNLTGAEQKITCECANTTVIVQRYEAD